MDAPKPMHGVPTFLRRMTDEDLTLFAKRKARACRVHVGEPKPEKLYLQLTEKATQLGLEPPLPGLGGKTLTGAIMRLSDERWWRRSLRVAVARECERLARDAGRVHRRAGIYVSDETLHRRRRRRQDTSELLACMEAVNELGDSFTLAELAARSVSNPQIRRSELMARISGFETVALELGHVAEFYTVTCPSRMHARHAASGAPVIGYDGTSPRQSQKYLSGLWQKVRAQWQRSGLRPYGIRVAEPNHDGTPHWHLLLFMPEEGKSKVRDALWHYALQVDGNEAGAKRHRLKVEAIDYNKGSAVGYVAKYISKNVDGYAIKEDEYGTAADMAAERIEAWSRVWGIRQFQQIGGPPVSVWRELRRLDTAPDGVLAEARLAADQGEWDRFVQLMHGPDTPRARQPVQLAKVWSDKTGEYGEPQGFQTFGVCANDLVLSTRKHLWTVSKRQGADRQAQNGLPFCAPVASELDCSSVIK